MSGLWSVVGIIALIAAVIFVQLLRSVLASPFPARVRLLGLAQAKPPEPLAPLFEQIDTPLTAAGFDHLGWVFLQIEPESTPGLRLVRLYVSADRRTLAQVIAPFTAQEPYRCRIHLISQAGDGRLVFTAPPMLQALSANPELALTQMAVYGSLSEQVQAHQTLTEAHDIKPWANLNNAVDRLQDYEDAHTQRARERGELLPHADGSLRFSIARAFAALRSALSLPKPAQTVQDDTEIPIKRAVLLWRHQRQLAHHSPRMPVQWGLFALSALAFAALGAWFWGLDFAVLLLAVIALHEAGHWWAMRAFGYRNVQMLMLPMVGGVTIGHERTPSAQARAWVSLMGPLPGIVLGCALFLSGIDVGSGWLFTAALLLLLINLFNLLPILPLDGGHLLHLLLPERATVVRTVFDTLAIVALAALAWWLDAWWLMLLALVPFSNLRNAGRDQRLLATLRQVRADTPPRNESDELEQALTVVRADNTASPAMPLLSQFTLADEALTRSRIEPMPRRALLQLGALWLSCFVATLALPQVRSLIAPLLTPPLSAQAIESAMADLQAQARALSTADLIREAASWLRKMDDATIDSAAAATAEELAAIEHRLGLTLHPTWRAIMLAEGGERLRQILDLNPPSQLAMLADRQDCLAWIEQSAAWPGFADGQSLLFTTIDASNDSNDERELDPDLLRNWLVLGGCDHDDHSLRLVEPGSVDWPVWELLLTERMAVREPDLRTTLEQLYVSTRLAQRLGSR